MRQIALHLLVPIIGVSALLGLVYMASLAFVVETKSVAEVRDELHILLFPEYVELVRQVQKDPESKFHGIDLMSVYDLLEFKEVSVRTGKPPNMYVRAVITIQGETPPLGPSTRYFLFEHDREVDIWKYRYEVSLASYYFSFFDYTRLGKPAQPISSPLKHLIRSR